MKRAFLILAGSYSLVLTILSVPYLRVDPLANGKPWILGGFSAALFFLGSAVFGNREPGERGVSRHKLLRYACLLGSFCGLLMMFTPFRAPDFLRMQKACFSNVKAMNGAWEIFRMDHPNAGALTGGDLASGGRLIGADYLKEPPSPPAPECFYLPTASGSEVPVMCRFHGIPGSPLPEPRSQEEAFDRLADRLGFPLVGIFGLLALPLLIFLGF